MKHSISVLCLLSLLSLHSLCVCSASSDAGSDNGDLYCTIGFGSSKNKIKIEPNQINDGYCDCPFENGMDEYETDACAGSTDWSGVGNGNGTDNDNDNGNDSNNPKMTCPQQPNIQLSYSKINDSICDCCDGYDEQQHPNLCPDICDEVLAAERKLRQEQKEKYIIGSKLRSEAIQTYQTELSDQLNTIKQLESNDIPLMTKKIKNYKSTLDTLKYDTWDTYQQYVKDKIHNKGDDWNMFLKVVLHPAMNLKNDLTNVTILQDIIASICHLHGELIHETGKGKDDDSSTSTSTSINSSTINSCLPLRLAGLDLGLLWIMRKDAGVTLERITDNSSNDENRPLILKLATLILNNHDENGQNKKGWNELKVGFDVDDKGVKQKKNKISRNDQPTTTKQPQKEKEVINDDHHDTMDDDDDSIYDDDEYDPEDGWGQDYYADSENDHHDNADEFIQDYNKKTKEETEDFDKGPPIGNNDVMSELEKILAKAKSKMGSGKIEEVKPVPVPVIADTHSTTIFEDYEFHSSLGQLLRAQFYDHAHTLRAKIDDTLRTKEPDSDEIYIEDDDDDYDDEEPRMNIDPMALKMVNNSLNHKVQLIEKGNEIASSAKTLLEVLYDQLLDDDKDDDDDMSEKLIISYLRNLLVGTIYYSDLYVADIAEVLALVTIDVEEVVGDESCFDLYYTLCSQGMNDLLSERCKERSEDNDSSLVCGDTTDATEMPSHISDGYYNFYMPKPRESNDLYSEAFQSMNEMKEIFKDSAEISTLDEEISIGEAELKELREKLESARSSIGKDDKYGPQGIFYEIRDDCLSVDANKYRYELCMFGQSKQREIGTSKGTGTNLGSWEGYSVEEKTGKLVLKWTNGAKCWNGPSRSSTIFVTCGAENKVISADEPNICEYVFKMESYMACDDTFKKLHNIEI